jgi:hypothetical protein
MYQVLGSIYKGRGAEGKEGKGKGREGKETIALFQARQHIEAMSVQSGMYVTIMKAILNQRFLVKTCQTPGEGL